MAKRKAATAGLDAYRNKRRFGVTAEPRGQVGRATGRDRRLAYVIQKHAARRLHYDLRLELDGVMKSWAVTRGPSLVPDDKRLAVHVEDHPLQYNTFEGTIPKGEYGGGTVMVWDRGEWRPEGDPHKGYKKGHLSFALHGKKLRGLWHLVRMQKKRGEKHEPWLLIKSNDAFARTRRQPDILEEKPKSAASGRGIDAIAKAEGAVWHSNEPARVNAARLAKAAASKTPGAATKRRATGKTSTAVKARRPRQPRAKKASRAKPARPDTKSTPKRRASSHTPDATLPHFIEPCLATLVDTAPSDPSWLHEVKFDGYRLQARCQNGTVALLTRTGLDWTGKFAPVATAIAERDAGNGILDGELVSVIDNGLSSFSQLQQDIKDARHDRMIYYAFDLLYRDGTDLRPRPLIERRKALEALLGTGREGIVRVSEAFDASGPTIQKHACRLGLEGIISKRTTAPYRSGRGRDWLKSKCVDRQEFVVIGYTDSTAAPRSLASLVLGHYHGGVLTYAGRVGTGFNRDTARDLWRKLDTLRSPAPALERVPPEERGARAPKWVRPAMVIEAAFHGWTHGGVIRQASFQGIREDKAPAEIVREQPMTISTSKTTRPSASRQRPSRKTAKSRPRAGDKSGSKASGAVEGSAIVLTHPDRVYWPDTGVTKQQLADYYVSIWPWMKPHIVGRVIALLRCPDGQNGQCFFQKHASSGIAEDRLRLVSEPDGDKAIAIDDLDGLIALVQAGVLEFHVRGSRIDHLEQADRLVFDLDPGPGVSWPALVQAARDVRSTLAALNLKSFVKTSGGKGLHVVAPVRPADWETVKSFCRAVAERMAAHKPDRYTAVIKKSARAGRVFIDYLRNSREATAIAAYSTRARDGAPVSVPIAWTELGSLKSSNQYTVQNLPRRLARLRKDPWADIFKIRQSLPKLPKARV